MRSGTGTTTHHTATAFSVAVLLACLQDAAGAPSGDGFCQGENADKICCKGGKGLLLPIFKCEDEWDRGLRAFLYIAGLLWCFLGVAVLSDTFMAGIEAITNSTYKKKVPRRTEDGKAELDEYGKVVIDEVDEPVWNAAVANLTLMALGSSTPEILLSIIEIVGGGFYAGDLGPGTVVGSASFNLYVITGICMMALEAGQLRKIEGLSVYALTASHSLLAYVWLALVVTVISPDVVEWWEALVTFLAMPWLVTLVYCADKNWFRKSQVHAEPEGDAVMSVKEPAQITSEPIGTSELIQGSDQASNNAEPDMHSFTPVRTMSAASTSSHMARPAGNQFASMANPNGKKSYLHYRRMGCAAGAGALKSVNFNTMAPRKEVSENTKGKELAELKAAIADSQQITTHCVYHWETTGYGFPEIEGLAKLNVVRAGKTDVAGSVRYCTVDGTAKNGVAYEAKDGVINFEPHETSKQVCITLIHDYEWNPDLDFFVVLEACETGHQVDGRSSRTTVTVVDADKAGNFAWSRANNTRVKHTERQAFLVIERRAAFGDTCYTKVATRNGNSMAGQHYEALDTVLEWRPFEMAKQIGVSLLPGEKPCDVDEWISRFYVDVTQVENKEGELMEGGETHTADVRVDYQGDPILNLEEDLGTVTWGHQFRQAMNVNGGGPLEEQTITDCVLHFLSIGWKLLAAFIPPPHLLGGWACFSVALCMVGFTTAIIGDLASIFGCLVGLEDSVTAFTIVALGTSLPDTFASVLAVRSDDSADNAVGNVTGSNAVNVFLGLGLPWLIASVYWGSVGASEEWKTRYAGWQYYDKYKDTGAFVVEGGALGFNTMIFSILTCFVFSFLFLRRKYVGAEIGGPDWSNKVSGAILISVWLIYVLVSALQVYHPDNFVAV